jgi:hypothetical protein
MEVLILLATLISISTAININCRFTLLTVQGVFNSKYTCDTSNIELTGSRVLENATGAHLINRNNGDVEALYFGLTNNCPHLTFIPEEATAIFPNLVALGFINCGFQTLSGNDLESYQNLQYFEIFGGPLVHIPGTLFNPTPSLRFAGFSSGQLSSVGPNLLDHLNNLTMARFHTPCIEMIAQNRQQVLHLIEVLNANCTNFGSETTTARTTTLFPTTTTADPSCPGGNIDSRVCSLEATNIEQLRINENLQRQLDEVNEILAELMSRPCSCK